MDEGEIRFALSRARYLLVFIACLATALFSVAARADSSSFDLIGPRIEMTVTRAGKTQPISSVPNFQPGDRLWIQTDFPENQSVHYLLIVAFLQGPTNPPPEDWFTRVDTWTKHAQQEGTVVTVPKNAQQVLLFLAPETGGDFTTLRSTVRGRPGVFVRASQDLNQAALDRTRVDKYLEEVRDTSNSDPTELHARTLLLAKTLRLKINEDCFDKPAEQQASCLTQNTDDLVMDDAHSQSLVAALTSGPSSDLVGAVSSTPLLDGGFYSAYVGTVMDLGRLMSSLHTAEYQYIPALALPKKDQLNLRLNSPPSFHNPKSVLVIGLPAVEAAQLPPLRTSDPKQVFCLQKSPLVLPIEGAPLVYSTPIAHDFDLRLQGKSGASVNVPATPDAARGGFVVDAHTLQVASLGPDITGTLHGFWGFDSFTGPAFQLRNSLPDKWAVVPADADVLVVGREDTIHLKPGCAACVEKVTVVNAKGKDLKATWKAHESDELEISIPLKDEPAGEMKMTVQQFGLAAPDVVTLHAYAEAAHLDRFSINAGDRDGLLTGSRLDEVGSFELQGVRFTPEKLSRQKEEDQLALAAPPAASLAAFQPGDTLTAHVSLKDGRVLDLQTTVDPPRPKLSLVSKNVQPGADPSAVRFASSDELPQDARLSFFLKSDVPAKFPHAEKIEVATVDGSYDVLLSLADGNLVLEDSQSVLAVLDPLKNFGPSAFGPLQFRAIGEDGAKGDWQPLANLVRVPALKDIHCPDAPDQQCTLRGTNLFLLDSVASDSQFKNMVEVPPGYVNSTISVPRPNGTLLYIKLRDDPAIVDTVALPVFPDVQ
ncbi:MAG TPA: hypothetical protein VMU43_05120 [Candidatus Acidoferrum sp.]|nr:hypothetical protein [Candidatus Acidoferrum sp.]